MKKTASSVSNLQQPAEKTLSAISGQGMDRKAEKKVPYGKFCLYAIGAAAMLLFVWWFVDTLAGGRSLTVNSQRISIASVTVGTYEDFIPLRGRLVPRSTVYLDAIEGGRVEEVLIEDGVLVEAGDPIAVLSNTDLQLNVLTREASVAEQLNNMRTIELTLEQNRLTHKRNLVDFDYQITRLNRTISRQRDLADRNLVPKSEMDDLQDELTYYENRREVTLETQETDTRMQEQQLQQLRETGERLESSLAIARQTLDDLAVKAPVSGKLSGFDIEVGQSISRGERLGQIDDPVGYKLNVEIDEYYLGRVDLGQMAVGEYNKGAYNLRISKIYPQVTDGLFNVDMQFEEDPLELRRGQTLQLKLVLGDNTDALLIPNGTFYQETGGAWVFVLASDGSEAVKRHVKLGRRNTEFIEVLEGLEPGEEVIVSPYTSYTDMDRLTLN